MRSFVTIVIAALFILPSCDNDSVCLKGSGQTNNYPIQVDAFDQVALSGPINLRITQGVVQEVVVVAEPEIFGELTFRVRNDVLEIGFENNVRCFETVLGVWVNVVVPDIRNVFASGASEIISNGNLDLDRLDITISGTGDISLSGNITDQNFDASGTLIVNNFNVLSKNTSIDISGTAEVEVNCEEKLDIEVSGAATIRYKGSPQITQDVSGALTLIDAN